MIALIIIVIYETNTENNFCLLVNRICRYFKCLMFDNVSLCKKQRNVNNKM